MDRLQKILSAAGVCSRRQAEAYLTAGRVAVNGRISSLGDKADPDRDRITVDGVPIPRREAEKVLERMEENHQKKPPGADLPPVSGGDGAGGPQDLHWLVRPGRNLWRPAAPVLLHCTGAPGTGLCHLGGPGPAGLRFSKGRGPFCQRRLLPGQPGLVPGHGKGRHGPGRRGRNRRSAFLSGPGNLSGPKPGPVYSRGSARGCGRRLPADLLAGGGPLSL